MKELYIKNLYMQYCAATGKKYDENNILMDTDFCDWLKVLSFQRDSYKSFLYNLGIDLTPSSVVEIGKGVNDTFGQYETTIVSRFGSTIPGIKNKSLIYTCDSVYILGDDKMEDTDTIGMYLTHNPYYDAQDDIYNLSRLYQLGTGICLGLYGSKSDLNMEKRIKFIRDFASEIGADMGYHYDTDYDNYFCCVKNDAKTLRGPEKRI